MAKGSRAKGNDFDVIIIGGGPGGLAVGSMLAKEGVSSAIIEKIQLSGVGIALLTSVVPA